MSITSSYTIVKDLAIGNTVAAMRGRQLARSRDQKQWVIITFDLSQPPMFHHLIGFIEKMSELQHPNIGPIREIEGDGNYLRVVYPVAKNTLAGHVAKNATASEQTVLKWIQQIGSVFRFVMQEARPVFDHLGPLDAGCCEIDDSGNISVNIVELWLRSGIVPTQTVDLSMAVSWAPEYYQEGAEVASTGAVDEKGQIWALGVVAYEAAMKTSPFVSDAPLILMEKIMQENPVISAEFSESFRDLLCRRLLAKRPSDRISVVDLLNDKLLLMTTTTTYNRKSLPRANSGRAMIAEQQEISQPDPDEVIEVCQAVSTDTYSQYSCRLL